MNLIEQFVQALHLQMQNPKWPLFQKQIILFVKPNKTSVVH